MLRRLIVVAIFASGMLATAALSQTLPLPQHLISANSAAGERLFFESDARETYFPAREQLRYTEVPVLLWGREHCDGAQRESNSGTLSP
jgi:hypothetical protein